MEDRCSSSVLEDRLVPTDRAYRRVLVALLLVGLVTFALLYATQPILPLFATSYRLKPAMASLAVSAATFGVSLALPVWGAISDRFGRRGPMLSALAVAATLLGTLAWSPNFAVLVVLRFVEGAAIAGVPSIAMAYLGEEVVPEALGRAMGLYIGGNSVGGMAGRVVVGALAERLGWRLSLTGLGGVALLLVLIVVRLLPQSRHFRPEARRFGQVLAAFGELLRRPELVVRFAQGFLLMAAFVAMYNYLTFLLVSPPYRLPLSEASSIYLLYLAGTAGATLLGRLADALGRRFVLIFSVLLAMAGATVTLEGALAVKILGIALFTAGFFGGHVSASTLVAEQAGRHRAAASSLYLSAYYLGSSLGGTLIGLLWQDFRWPGVVAGLLLALLPALWLAVVPSKAHLSQPVAPPR